MTVELERVVLPSNVTPEHYELTLWPNLQTFIFKGKILININIHEATSTIHLNAKELNISNAYVTINDGETYKTSDIEITTGNVAILTFAQTVPVGPAVLGIDFEGTHNTKMTGFYRSQYKNKEGETKYMAVTQLASCDARRAFPCWDEPALKATFSVTLVVPSDLVALSNTPIKEIEVMNPDEKIVHFEKTPIMSTYLVAFAVGDFEYIETTTTKLEKPITCRVYTLPGLVEQGRLALEITPKILEFYTEIFGITYPLTKLDNIAIPDFDAGAMENWGLITYRTAALLYDEKTSDAKYKEMVAYVVAHEIAHQWFGNLVTMEWWDHLWLNEGFATWVGYLAVDHLFPEWNIWSNFVITQYQYGLSLDCLRSSHPIEVPIAGAHDVNQIFDHISYCKGASVIRMLSSWLKTDVFLAGIRRYLNKFLYKNASTNDLWDALSEESNVDVREFMENWTRTMGFPVLNVTEEPGFVTVEQHRYLSTNDVTEEEDKRLWWIPMGMDPKPDSIVDKNQTLTTRNLRFQVPHTKDGNDLYFFNKNTTGVFRVNYPASAIRRLGLAIQAGNPVLGITERAGILADQVNLATSGHIGVERVFDLIQYYKNEKSFVVWDICLDRLDHIAQLFSTNERTREAISNFQRKLLDDIAEELGWEFPKDESYLTARLRGSVIIFAGRSGRKKTVEEALQKFRAFMKDGANQDEVIHPTARKAVFEIAISHGGVKEFEQIANYYKTTPKQDQQAMCLNALGRSVHGELIQRLFDFALSDDVRHQDFVDVLVGLAANVHARGVTWGWIKSNWPTLVERYTGNISTLGLCIKMPLRVVSDPAVIKDLEDFFVGKDTKEYDRDLEQAKEGIRIRSQWLSRDEKALESWLIKQGY
ncbi:hypothetical protein BGZ76_006096 [Entomortierella beljakovae]|nr:hypothetical protein BGZ76_006096 [Entomortierella beljakovae]